MEVIKARNVNDALILGLDLLVTKGTKGDSRNGPVVELCPVTTVYEKPCERVIFYKERDANPFFHFFECLWMLQGRNDVKWISMFNNQIKNYSDDEETFHGAYGYRWRKHFNVDQLKTIVQKLKHDSKDRRAVLAMWDTFTDGEYQGKDLPCNTHIYFWVREDKLNMTVCNRSNDVIWGAYGANAVHMSFLQEYIARSLGVGVGTYNQMSNNFHAYTESASSKVYDRCLTLLDQEYIRVDPYTTGEIEPFPIMKLGTTQEDWDRDLGLFMEDPLLADVLEPFFMNVARPLYEAYRVYKQKDFVTAKYYTNRCFAQDWKQACLEWIERREVNHLKKLGVAE